MEIILIKDVPKLGFATDLVKVRDGFATNYLIPQGFAIQATESAIKVNNENIKQKTFKDKKLKEQAESLATLLNNITVKIGAKAAATGKIFGSVNAIQIADAIKEQHNYEVDRKKIHLNDPVKELGNYKADVILYKGIVATVNFEVVAE